ncbi:MAG: ATP-binding protein, partial [Thermoleophilaceae bacterium]
MTPLPAALLLTPSFPFVGRVQELDTLRTLMPLAEGEGRRVALVGGEPGSGKSRLMREVAHEVAARGAQVLYGSCEADLRTPYKPFLETLDQLVRRSEPALLRSALGSTGAELKRLLPGIEMRSGALGTPIEADPDTERHRLHTAVTDLLVAAGRQDPLLLILEDLHWADGATLLLLRHLARSAAEARMLVLVTFRDSDADLAGAPSETLVELRRAEGVVRMRLGGLSTGDLVELIRGVADGEPDPELANAIGELTDGNPFLVCELWRALVDSGALEESGGCIALARPLEATASPQSVRELVSQRLARLRPTTAALLELAAVSGAAFELDPVRRASELEEPALLAALEEAERSGLIDALPVPVLAYRFAHELVRRALYDRLPASRRAELHLKVAEALEAAHQHDPRPALPALAHHYAAAAPLGAAERAVDYNLRAARAAESALAYDEAAARFEAALGLGIADPGAQAEARLELGWAQIRGGRYADALGIFRAAAQIARERDDAPLLARAAIGFEDAWWRPGMTDTDAIELLEEAAARLGEADDTLRVRVLGGLSRALARVGRFERGAVVHESAVALARRLGDRAALATVLTRSYWQRGAWTTDDVLELLEEARRIGEELGAVEIRGEAMSWKVPALVTLGELRSARRELGVLLDTAAQTGQPFMLHVAEHYGAALALCEGRLDEAEQRANRSRELSRQLTGRDASGIHGIQMFSVRREQGRLAEVAPAIRLLLHDERASGPWRPGLAALLAELGMAGEARRELERIRTGGIGDLRESLWLGGLAYLADACS